MVPPPDCTSVLKIKKMRTDEAGQEVATGVPPPVRSVGVVVSPMGGKRKCDDSGDWPLTSICPSPPPPLSPQFQLESVDQLLTSVEGPLFFGK